jgi:hypothetical protein
VYLNGDTSNGKQPWDAVHNYRPVVYQGNTDTLPNVDDSAWISPGFWSYGDSPVLERSLSEFKSAWNNIVEKKDSYRFVLIETWNEWHEGTQIEPGQEIIPDPQGFRSKLNGDYGYTFIDAIAPAAVNDLHWTSAGHRASVPVRLEAEEMIWDDDSKIELLEENPNKVLISEKDVRIGSSIFIPYDTDSNGVVFTVKANSKAGTGRFVAYPKMGLYLDDSLVSEWEVQRAVPNLGIESNDQDYSAVVYVEKGIHKVELAMTDEVGNWDLIVDSIDVNAVFVEGPDTIDPNAETPDFEGFETRDFSTFEWKFYGEQDWFVTSNERNSGLYNAEAGPIGDDESSTLEVTLDCVSGDISFYCKVSSEESFDYLSFYIDGMLQDKWSGEQAWTQASFPVTEGTRTFRWEYSKDSSVSDGDDTAWIDDIVFPVYGNNALP